MIDFTKPVQTLDGRPVTILSNKGHPSHPIVGLIADIYLPYSWTLEGYSCLGFDPHNPNNLMQVPKVLDLSRPVQTESGEPVKLLSTDAHPDYPLAGLIGPYPFNVRPGIWTKQGFYYADSPGEKLDLVNVPDSERDLITLAYFNVYEHTDRGGFSYHSHSKRSDADKFAGADRVACVRVQFTKGQFDD